MPLFSPHIVTPDSALGGKVIEKSLRFNGDNTYLNRTPTSTSNRRTWTWSAWIKKAKNDAVQDLFSAYSGSIYNIIRIGSSNELYFQKHTANIKKTNAKLRDTTSWYHIVVAIDTTSGTAADRVIIYINGSRQSLAIDNSVSQNTDYAFNITSQPHTIGVYANGSSYNFDGYMAEINFVDGYQYDPSYFGYTESQTGMWRPKKYEGTHGTNGFHLDFHDSSSVAALGHDRSGNGNNYSLNNFSVTAGEDNDSVEDTPSNNFCTLNPLNLGSGTLIEGGLETSPLNAGYAVRGTNFVSSGKWYFEFVVTAGTNMPTYAMVGIQRDSGSLGSYSGTVNIPDGYGLLLFGSTSYLYNGTTATAYNIGATSFNDVIGVAFDLDKGEIYFYRDGSLLGGGAPAYSNITQGNYAPHVSNQTTSNNDMACFVNFGQRPFAHTPPTGYRALNSRNLATPVAARSIRPQRHFDTLTWAGNSTNGHTIDGLEFTPDLVWIKNRSESVGHYWVDSMRKSGSDYLYFNTNEDNAEGDASARFTSINRGGFTLPGGGTFTNSSGDNFVGWCWKAGGAAVSNTDGSITSSVSANQEGGFSIVTWTGTGSDGTIGHGLGAVPSIYFVKRRNSAKDWYVQIGNINDISLGRFLKLNSNTTINFASDVFAASADTSTVLNTKSDSATNASGDTYVAYCWTSIPGYSKFGSYKGNGNADGAYVDLGFRPAWLMIKNTATSGWWFIYDVKRETYNPMYNIFGSNVSNAEYYDNAYKIDILSNGFKARGTQPEINKDGDTIIYMAFAEQPSGTIFGIDANAR